MLIMAIPLAVTVYAFIDVLSTRPHACRRASKVLWALAVLLLPLLGALMWFLFGRPRRVRSGPGYSAPDDDPDFLREIARRTRKPDDGTTGGGRPATPSES